MTNLVLTWIGTQLAQAKTPEDIFGELKGNQAEQASALKGLYHQMAKATHPDAYPAADEQAIAQLTFTRLSEWFARAEEKIKRGEYGKKPGSVDRTAAALHTSRRDYSVAGGCVEDFIYMTYPCTFQEGSQPGLAGGDHSRG